jgi:hypothetical protein
MRPKRIWMSARCNVRGSASAAHDAPTWIKYLDDERQDCTVHCADGRNSEAAQRPPRLHDEADRAPERPASAEIVFLVISSTTRRNAPHV